MPSPHPCVAVAEVAARVRPPLASVPALPKGPLSRAPRERVQARPPPHSARLPCVCVYVCLCGHTHAPAPGSRSHTRHTRWPHAPPALGARVSRTAQQPSRAPRSRASRAGPFVGGRGAVQHRGPPSPLPPACPGPAAARPRGAHSPPASSSSSGGSSGGSPAARSSQPMVQPSPPAAAAARRLGRRQGPRGRRRRRAPAPLARLAVTHPRPRPAACRGRAPAETRRARGRPPLRFVPGAQPANQHRRGLEGRGRDHDHLEVRASHLAASGAEATCPRCSEGGGHAGAI